MRTVTVSLSFILIKIDIIVVACADSFIADLTEECRKKDLEKTFMRQVNISTFFGLTLKMKLNLSISKI